MPNWLFFKRPNKHLYTVAVTLVTSFLIVLPVVFYLKYLHRKNIAKINRLERVIYAHKELTGSLEDYPYVGFFPAQEGSKKIPSPGQLAHLPSASAMGIVEKVTPVAIEGIAAPYNASMVEAQPSGYHLFFRYDRPTPVIRGNPPPKIPYHTFIGYNRLDEHFLPIDPPQTIDVGSEHAEDPRIVKVGSSFYLVYNDLVKESPLYRTMRLAKWNPTTLKAESAVELDLSYKPIEKNWTPFAYSDGKKEHLHLIYTVYPHKVLYLPEPTQMDLRHLPFSDKNRWQTSPWATRWGSLSGGTPPRLVHGEYLSFFHSWFRNRGCVWYVMGAYTFEPTPPFRLTSISEFPILFDGIYNSEKVGAASDDKYVIFPAGFTVEECSDGQTRLHVACGENDASIKILTINYRALKKSLKKVPLEPLISPLP